MENFSIFPKNLCKFTDSKSNRNLWQPIKVMSNSKFQNWKESNGKSLHYLFPRSHGNSQILKKSWWKLISWRDIALKRRIGHWPGFIKWPVINYYKIWLLWILMNKGMLEDDRTKVTILVNGCKYQILWFMLKEQMDNLIVVLISFSNCIYEMKADSLTRFNIK